MGPLITKRRHYATPIAATTLTTHYGATTTLNRPSSSSFLWLVVVVPLRGCGTLRVADGARRESGIRVGGRPDVSILSNSWTRVQPKDR